VAIPAIRRPLPGDALAGAAWERSDWADGLLPAAGGATGGACSAAAGCAAVAGVCLSSKARQCRWYRHRARPAAPRPWRRLPTGKRSWPLALCFPCCPLALPESLSERAAGTCSIACHVRVRFQASSSAEKERGWQGASKGGATPAERFPCRDRPTQGSLALSRSAACVRRPCARRPGCGRRSCALPRPGPFRDHR